MEKPELCSIQRKHNSIKADRPSYERLIRMTYWFESHIPWFSNGYATSGKTLSDPLTLDQLRAASRIGANLMAYARPSQSANDLIGPPEVALTLCDDARQPTARQ
jgi:hypothetical protein